MMFLVELWDESLAEEVTLLCKGKEISERFIVFLAVILQRDTMVTKTIDICRVFRHRIDLWRHEQFDTLIFEFLRCSKLWINPEQPKPIQSTN